MNDLHAAEPSIIEQAEKLPPPPVFLAFQGGGARGVAHVGALAAVDELGLEIAGVAGTSAGGIMAALVAGGYSAKELLDPEARTHLLENVAGGRFKKATSLFLRPDWCRIRSLRGAGSFWRWLGDKGITSTLGRLWSRPGKRAILLAIALLAVILLARHAPVWSFLIILGLAVSVIWLISYLLSGLATLHEVRALVDEALATRFETERRDITFADLRELGGRPLKIVATNVSGGGKGLELFSVETTPGVAVADAVAASICLPVVFKPWAFPVLRAGEATANDQRFIDGGLLSNLPAWTFDEERALQPHALTLAFGLTPPTEHGDESSWFASALRTIVAGPAEIHFRGIDRLIHVPLDCKLGVLDFDASFDALSGAVIGAKKDADLHLRQQLTDVPSAVRQMLADLQRDLTDALTDVFAAEFRDWRAETPLFRIAFAIQRPADRLSLTIAYELGHDISLKGVRLSLTESGAGLAWHGEARPSKDPENQLYRDGQWIGYVPLWGEVVAENDDGSSRGAEGEAAVVAIFDSDARLPASIWEDDETFTEFWFALSDTASEFFDDGKVGALFRRSIAWI